MQLKEHHQQFRKIVARAELAFRRGNLHSAIAWSQVAAHFAWERHPGLYYDLNLESLLTQIANQVNEKSVKVNTQMIIPAKSDSKKKHVLHVITGCKGLGGHTLVVTGWINNTFENVVHSIVATTQLEPLPLELTSFPKKSGGWSMQLGKVFFRSCRAESSIAPLSKLGRLDCYPCKSFRCPTKCGFWRRRWTSCYFP